MKTFKDFSDELRARIWPAGEARTLKAAHTKQFMAALTDLQKNVPELQQHNISSFDKCARYWEDGATVVDCPNGVVARVFTIANGNWCFPAGTMVTCDIGQVPIERVTSSHKVLTRSGFKQVTWSGETHRSVPVLLLELENGASVRATANHLFWTVNRGWVRLDCVNESDIVLTCPTQNARRSALTELASGGIRTRETRVTEGTFSRNIRLCIERFGRTITKWKFHVDLMCTIAMGIGITILQKTWNVFQSQHIIVNIGIAAAPIPSSAWSADGNLERGRFTRKGLNFVQEIAATKVAGNVEMISMNKYASGAVRNTRSTSTTNSDFVPVRVRSITVGRNERVFDLSVDGSHEFFADGILVHNCDKVLYWSDNYVGMQRWQKRLFEAVTPANLGLPALPQGFRFDDGTVDSKNGRAHIGIWTIYRRRVYVAPWLQSNETLLIEWDGVKDSWADADGIDDSLWTLDVQEAIEHYVRWQHEMRYGDSQTGSFFQDQYVKKRGDVMLTLRDRTKQQPVDEIPEAQRFLQQSDVDDDAAPAVTSSWNYAFISDWGKSGQPLTDVIGQIKAINPQLVLTGGDNVFSGNTAADLFPLFSPLKVKPTFGDHDFIYSADLSAFFAVLPELADKHYYTAVSGPVQFFLVGNEQAEPDNGYVDANTSTEGSIAGEWLKVMLAVSTAKWKVVVLPANPYSSDSILTPGKKWARWPLAAWGADLVLTGDGHVFEHIKQDGLNYFECGLGGEPLGTFGADTDADEIVSQWSDSYAFLSLSATCDNFTVRLIDRAGTQQYLYTLTK